MATMSRAISHKLGWSFKKRRWVPPPSETKKLEVLGARTPEIGRSAAPPSLRGRKLDERRHGLALR